MYGLMNEQRDRKMCRFTTEYNKISVVECK